MIAEAQLATTLGAVPAIVSLVTGPKGSRLGPKASLPADGIASPALTYERISTLPFDDLTSGGPLDLVRMQVDAWGRTASEAITLATLARDAIAPADSLGIGKLDAKEGALLDQETRAWGVRADYIIFEERT